MNDQHHFMLQQQLQNGGAQTHNFYARWSNDSPQQGPVYAVSKSERAESRRTSSDLGDPGKREFSNFKDFCISQATVVLQMHRNVCAHSRRK